MQLGPYRETKEVIRDDIEQVILSLRVLIFQIKMSTWKNPEKYWSKYYLEAGYTKPYNQPQRTTTSHNKPQSPTMRYNHPQSSTTSRNDPQLRHKMNKTHKKLHSLVNSLSPLNTLAAGILMKIILILMLVQGSGIILFVVEAFGSVFVCVILRTWQLKGEKGNVNLLQNLFYVFIFSFSSLENLGRGQRQRFPYSLEAF